MKIIQKFIFPIGLLLAMVLVDPNLMDVSLLSKKLVLGIALFLIALFFLFNRGNLKIHIHQSLGWIILLFLLSRGISIFYGRNFGDGFFEFSKNLETFLLLLFLLITYPTKESFLKRFSIPFFLFVLLISIIGWFQISQIYIDGHILTKDTYYVKSLFSHRNMFAQILVFSLPFSLYYFSKNVLLKILSIGSVLSSLGLIGLLFCRSAWLAVFLSFSVMALMFLIHNIRSKSKLIGLGLSVVLLALLAFPIKSLVNPEDVQNQMHTFTNWHYGSAKKRVEIWKGTSKLIQEKSILGHGLGDWKIEINRHIGSKEVTEDSHTFYQRPHNDFLWIWSESGIISVLLYLILFVLFLKISWKSLRSNLSLSNPAFVALFGLLSYLVIALLSFPMERIEHQVFFGLFLFLALPSEQHNYKTLNLKTLILILISLSFILFTDLMRYSGERNMKKALVEKDRGNWIDLQNRISEGKSAFYMLDGTSTPLFWYSGLAKMNVKNFPEALLDFQKAKKTNPYHIHVLNSLGSMYFANAQLDSAQANYRELLKINPRFNDAIVNSAMIYFNQQTFDAGIKILENIDVKKLNERQEAIIYRILKTVLMQMVEVEQDANRKSVLQRISISQSWTLDIFKKQLEENRSFEEQVHADVEYLMNDV